MSNKTKTTVHYNSQKGVSGYLKPKGQTKKELDEVFEPPKPKKK